MVVFFSAMGIVSFLVQLHCRKWKASIHELEMQTEFEIMDPLIWERDCRS